MKAPPFAYVRANSLPHAFELIARHGLDARVLAGGQTLIGTLAFRLSEPTVLIDISRLTELDGITVDGERLRIGAATTHTTLGRNPLVTTHTPLLTDAVPLIAHAAIRNRGTIGGSLAYADPAAELPACCVALGANIVATSAKSERRIPAGAFFTDLFTTALADNELITAIEVPVARSNQRHAIVELARRSGDYAMAGIAARLAFDGEIVSDASLALFGVGVTPVTATHAANALIGQPLNAASMAAAKADLDADIDPPADQHGGATMKRHLARVVLGRALQQIANPSKANAA